MFGNQKPRPVEPVRTIWADATRKKLEDITARKRALHEQLNALDEEARGVESLCNHTFPDGTSAIKVRYDPGDPYDGWESRTYTRCTVCGT